MKTKDKFLNKNNSLSQNCNNCKYLEYVFGDVGDSEGFVCNKVDLFGEQERVMLNNMGSVKYRNKSKKCFIAR